MFDFRLFPGTNFNRVNLDWIFSKLKELQKGQSTVTEAAEEATEAAEEATAAAATASQAASDAIEAIETVTETAEDAQTRAAAAETTAAAAQQTATNAGTAAATAQQTADNAASAADNAASAAAEAQQTATNAGTAAAAAAAHAIVNVQTIDSWVCVTFAGGRVLAFKTVPFTTDVTTNVGNLYWSTNALDLGNHPSNFFNTTKTIHRFYSVTTSTNSIAWCAVYGVTGNYAGHLKIFRATARSEEDTYQISVFLIGERT